MGKLTTSEKKLLKKILVKEAPAEDMGNNERRYVRLGDLEAFENGEDVGTPVDGMEEGGYENFDKEIQEATDELMDEEDCE